MADQNVNQLISDAVNSVLETMFFSAPFRLSEEEAGPSCIKVRVRFRGCPSGVLEVCVSDKSARILASSFLGEDEEMLTDMQPREMVCELSNMLCGSLISKMETEHTFDLDSPQVVLEDGGIEESLIIRTAGRQNFELEGGILTVRLHLQAVS